MLFPSDLISLGYIKGFDLIRSGEHPSIHAHTKIFQAFRLDHQLSGINHCWVNPTTFNQQHLPFLWTHNGDGVTLSIKIFKKSSNKRDWNWATADQSWRILEQIFLDFAVLDIDIIMSGYPGIKTQKRLWITFHFYFLTVFLNDKVNIITLKVCSYQSGGFSIGFYPQTWRQAWSRPAEPQSVP